MKVIQVLGGENCPKAKKLTEQVEAVARRMGIDYRLERVEELSEIMNFGAVTTPALVIDGDVAFMGKLPDAEQIAAVLR